MNILFESEAIQIALLTTDKAPDEVEQLIRMFEAIAVEQSWQTGDQLRAYPRNSVYFAAYVGGDLAGGLQLVIGNEDEGLPCLTVWPELDLLGRKDVGDVALLALDRKHRGARNLFWLLFTEMWRYCIRQHISELWLEATPPMISFYRLLGWALETAGDLRLHWGEPCYPCHLFVTPGKETSLARAIKAQYYQQPPKH